MSQSRGTRHLRHQGHTGDLGSRRGWRQSLVAAVVLALAACSGEVEEPVVFVEPTGPWAEEIAAAQQDASSEFEQRVLADAKVTREEYEEAHQLWLTCMEDAIPPDTGFTIALEEDAQGLYSTLVNIPAGMESAFENVNYDAISRECSQGTLDLVTALYADITRFPTRSYEEGVVRA